LSGSHGVNEGVFDEFERLFAVEEEVEEESQGDVASFCSRSEIGLFLMNLAQTVADALNVGVKVIVDVEPVLYESALSLLSVATYCSKFWSRVLAVKEKTSGSIMHLDFSLYVPKYGGDSRVGVILDRERKVDEFIDKVDMALTKPNLVYFAVVSKPPEVSLSAALYRNDVILESVRRVLEDLGSRQDPDAGEYREKLRFVGRVPHETCLFMPAEVVMDVARRWTPPPPANADYLKEKPRRLEELVLPPVFKELLSQYVKVVSSEGRGSLMLVGLHGSGRKTIARSLSLELGLPAYVVSVANMLSRYVGESEGKMNAFFNSLRARGGLAVFDSVDSLFRETHGESVTPNLRSILYQQMSREDNNFVMVFTVTEDAPEVVFDSPLLGEVKLVVPLPGEEERRRLTRMFLRELAGDSWDRLVAVAKKLIRRNDDADAEGVLYSAYAEVFVGPTIGFAPGEIYQLMKLIVKPSIEYTLRHERLANAVDLVLKYSKRDLAARQAKIRHLARKAASLGWMDVAQELERMEEEITRRVIAEERRVKRF